MRSLAAYVMRGRLQAVSAVVGLGVLSLLIPLVNLLSAAALGLVALRQGFLESGRVLGISLLAAAVLGAMAAGDPLPAVAFGLLLWVPIWVTALLLRESGQLALTLEAATAIALLAAGGIYAAMDDPASRAASALSQFVQPMLEHAPPGVDPERMRAGVEFLSHYVVGIGAAGALLSLTLGLLLARWQQALLYNPGGFRAEFLSLRLHRGAVYGGLVILATALASSGVLAELGWNLILPFFVLCLFTGVAILHAVTARAHKLWLIGIYVLVFLMPQITLPVALLGLTDTWLDWRSRFVRGA